MEYIKLMLISMVPVIELRGAIPLGIAIELDPIYVYLSCLIGSSIVSIPVVLVFRQVIDYLRHRKYFNIVIRWVDAKIESRAKKLKAASILGLIIFVGVPLPTTGSWSIYRKCHCRNYNAYSIFAYIRRFYWDDNSICTISFSRNSILHI